MTDKLKRGPPVPLAHLWRNTNAQGEPYLSGYMGKAKVLALPNRDRQDERNSSHGRFVSLPVVEPWHDPVTTAGLLDGLAAAVARHVVLPPAAAVAVALWVAHQAAGAHAHAMCLLASADAWLCEADAVRLVQPGRAQLCSTEAARMTSAAAGMMDAHQGALATLARLRTGGQQVVTVVGHQRCRTGGATSTGARQGHTCRKAWSGSGWQPRDTRAGRPTCARPRRNGVPRPGRRLRCGGCCGRA